MSEQGSEADCEAVAEEKPCSPVEEDRNSEGVGSSLNHRSESGDGAGDKAGPPEVTPMDRDTSVETPQDSSPQEMKEGDVDSPSASACDVSNCLSGQETGTRPKVKKVKKARNRESLDSASAATNSKRPRDDTSLEADAEMSGQSAEPEAADPAGPSSPDPAESSPADSGDTSGEAVQDSTSSSSVVSPASRLDFSLSDADLIRRTALASIFPVPSGSEDDEFEDGSDGPPHNPDDSSGESSRESMQNVNKRTDEILAKSKPPHSWSLIKELHKRQVGDRLSLLNQDRFKLRQYSSLHAVQRLELMAKLQWHDGCVNCLHFSADGSRLASGSDDLNVVVWDWQRQRPSFTYNTGHKSNIFEAKFVPLCGDTHIVSTSRDGQVRLAEVSPAGECRSVRRLAQHRGSGRKLALQPDSPHSILSCGEDAVVFNIDLRLSKPDVLVVCKHEGQKVPTNSISAHPTDANHFLLACVDKYVRLYDRRMIGTDRPVYRRFCPHKLLLGSRSRYSVTCAVFNYNGTEMIASYNDEDIYMFDTAHSDGANAVHQYSGHRNNATIKGVNYFGPTSQYVVSGSDCGNILFWDKDTESIVQCMAGDENGVVNCLEGHPTMPLLATSGLDHDVKIWVPSADKEPDLTTLRKTVETNLSDRAEDHPTTGRLGGGLMWALMQQVLRAERRRNQFRTDGLDEDLDVSSDSDEDRPTDCRPV